MHKKLRRILTGIACVILCLVFGLLAACGNNSGAPYIGRKRQLVRQRRGYPAFPRPALRVKRAIREIRVIPARAGSTEDPSDDPAPRPVERELCRRGRLHVRLYG